MFFFLKKVLISVVWLCFLFFSFLVECDDGCLSFSFMVPAIIKILTLAQVFIPQRWKHLRSVFFYFYFFIYTLLCNGFRVRLTVTRELIGVSTPLP